MKVQSLLPPQRQAAAKLHRYQHLIPQYIELFHEMLNEFRKTRGVDWSSGNATNSNNKEDQRFQPTNYVRHVLDEMGKKYETQFTILIDPTIWGGFSQAQQMKDTLATMQKLLVDAYHLQTYGVERESQPGTSGWRSLDSHHFVP